MTASSAPGVELPAAADLATVVAEGSIEAEPATELLPWLEEQLGLWAGRCETLVISVPAPELEPEALLEIAAGPSALDLAFFWHPPDGPAVAGVGATRSIQLSGPERFRSLRREAARVWKGLAAVAHPSCPAPAPRLYGGLAFDIGAADAEPWTEFGDGCFILPRLAYRADGGRATLSLTAAGRELAAEAGRDAAIAELTSALAALAGWRTTPTAAPELVEIRRPSRLAFAAEVEAIREAIAAGAFEKIVAARPSRATLGSPLESSAVLRLLRRGLRASTRFAFCRRDASFLGATPERLVARRGRSIETEALAGSIASGAGARIAERAARLLASGKDLREHQLVVDQIVRRLRPLTDALEVAREPRVRELRDVLHLHTPIAGTLATSLHVLELVEALHPTPAVGGVPAEPAMRWIREHEPDPRGWYAAPIGWFDAAGDGEFAVALRSCVLRAAPTSRARRGAEAFIYAGAGIVRDSDPELEYTETELKKQALLTALGAGSQAAASRR